MNYLLSLSEHLLGKAVTGIFAQKRWRSSVGFVPGVETPLDALRLTAPPWAHPGQFSNAHQSTK
jgi:hypothetical protein